MRILLISAILTTGLLGIEVRAQDAAANKEMVLAFYDLAFNMRQPTQAAKKFIGENFTQHSPQLANGRKGFEDHYKKYFKKNPKAQAEVKRAAADDNIVFVHAHSKLDENDRGQAVVDIFRVEKGKIVEQWSVSQEVPEKAANSNSVF